MTALHTRLFGLLATIWGGILLYFYVSLRVTKYLSPSFHHFVLIGGLGIIVLGLYSLINPQEKTSCCDHEHDEHDHHHEDCDHHHDDGHGPLTTYVLTLVPLVIALVFTADRFSARGIQRLAQEAAPPPSSQPLTLEDLKEQVPQNAKGEFQLSLVNAYYAGSDRNIHKVLDGIPVEIEGRLMREELNNPDGKRRRLYRIFISCCAADATAAGISLVFANVTPDPPDDTWVKASGTLAFEEREGRSHTILNVKALTPSEEPYSEFLQRNR